MPTSLFDRVAEIVDEIGVEKKAAAREKRAETGIPDPGGYSGETSHPSKKTDDDLKPASEGFQSADNTKIVKESIPDSVDSKSDETADGAPKATDVQLGQGVDKAKPTGEDSSTEGDYKGKLEGDKRVGDQGGTTHPATGDYGEKYSSDRIATMSDEVLLKCAAAIGNELVADIGSGVFSSKPAAKPTTKQAADAGRTVAAHAGTAGQQLEKVASGVVQEVVKSAYHQADLVSEHLAKELKALRQKRAEEEGGKDDGSGEGSDPTSGAGEGEDHGTESGGGSEGAEGSPEGGESGAPEGASDLLAAMGGGGDPMGGGGGDPMGGAGADPLAGAMGGGDPMGGMGGPPAGGDPLAAAGGAPGAGAPPPEMGAMSDPAALQQLAMALLEAGIDPAQLAALGNQQATKIASAVANHRRSGRFQFEEAKRGSAERKVRDYMKGFVLELYSRSQR